MGLQAVYRTIALDLAKRIVQGEFKEGEKISGRTLLSGQYSVSPETIRKAIAVLREQQAVQVSQGKEVVIASVSQAAAFLSNHEQGDFVYSLRQELEEILSEKEKLDSCFHRIVTDVALYSDRLKNIQIYNPVEISLPEGSAFCGQTLRTLGVRQSAGVLAVAVRRGTEVWVAPDPDLRLEARDILVFIGEKDRVKAVRQWIEG